MANKIKEIIKDELQDVEMIVDENSIKQYIYEIRGKKVMLDYDLAKIYGYSTKALNQQVRRNITKFDSERFMFQLTDKEVSILSRSQIVTMNKTPQRGENIKYNPFAFTEPGIYMLMTVLKGELATRQTKALTLAFEALKNYYVETNNLITTSGIIELTSQVNKNTDDIQQIKEENKVIKNQLVKVMDNFIDPSKYRHFLIMNGERIEADIAYQSIYKLAKHSIIIVDNYIGVKTLQLLKVIDKDISITIYSDNKAKEGITDNILKDFVLDSGLSITLLPNNNRIHDRYIFIDYKSDSETIFHCGSSSKDSGNKVTTIMKVDDVEIYHSLFE